MEKETKKENSKQLPIQRRVYYWGFLIIFSLYMGCKEEEGNNAIRWSYQNNQNSDFHLNIISGKKDGLVINDHPTYLFVLPPDTINLLNKREFIDVLYSFGRIFSSITVVDYQNIKVATGVDSYSWIKHNNRATDSSVHIIPITSIYNVKNKNQITIPWRYFSYKNAENKGNCTLCI